jgi:hypothetical protein
MEFLVCEKMTGEGCDYTIGCGMRFDFIEAESIAEAAEKTVWPDGRDEYCALEGEQALSNILIVPAEYVTVVDVHGLKQTVAADKGLEFARLQEEHDRAELARLQAKYETT